MNWLLQYTCALSHVLHKACVRLPAGEPFPSVSIQGLEHVGPYPVLLCRRSVHSLSQFYPCSRRELFTCTVGVLVNGSDGLQCHTA